MLDKLKTTWKLWAAFLVVSLTILAVNYFFGTAIPLPTPPLEYKVGQVWTQEDGWQNAYNAGYIRDDAAVESLQAKLAFKTFGDTPAAGVQDIPKFVYLWQLYGPNGPEIKNQNPVGSCVAFGTDGAVEDTMMAQIKLLKLPEEFKSICEEATYAGSRVEIGGGRLRGGDGSNGAWAVDYLKTRGLTPREIIKTKAGKVYDLTKYDPARCRAWGNSGVPDDLEEMAREHPVKDATLITSLDDLEKALAQGYGCAVCSDQGFTMARDSRGVCRPSGSWAHCMKFDGYHTLDDGTKFYHITNSWGANAHTGPTGWGNPNTAGFWCDARTAQSMIRDGRCTWAFSGVKGFPARQVDSEWFVQLNLKNRPLADVRLAHVDFLKPKRGVPCVEFSLSP